MAVSTKGEPTTSPAIQESIGKDVLSQNDEVGAIRSRGVGLQDGADSTTSGSDFESSDESSNGKQEVEELGSDTTVDDDDAAVSKAGKAAPADEAHEKICIKDDETEFAKLTSGVQIDHGSDEQAKDLMHFEQQVECDAKGMVTAKETGEKIGFIAEFEDEINISVKCKKTL